jgi:hypothetical protein
MEIEVVAGGWRFAYPPYGFSNWIEVVVARIGRADQRSVIRHDVHEPMFRWRARLLLVDGATLIHPTVFSIGLRLWLVALVGWISAAPSAMMGINRWFDE